MRIEKPLERQLQERIRVTEDGCWEWLRAKTKDGYGRWIIEGREWKSHRKSYEMFVGPIPQGYEIDHLCKNPSCANWEHLEAVTRTVNMERSNAPSMVNARKTHCLNGHEFTAENTHITRTGGRQCVICARVRADLWKEANPDKVLKSGREATRKYRQEHREELNAKSREAMAKRRSENREAYNVYMKEYQRVRRAMKKAAGSS